MLSAHEKLYNWTEWTAMPPVIDLNGQTNIYIFYLHLLFIRTRISCCNDWEFYIHTHTPSGTHKHTHIYNTYINIYIDVSKCIFLCVFEELCSVSLFRIYPVRDFVLWKQMFTYVARVKWNAGKALVIRPGKNWSNLYIRLAGWELC